MPELRANIISRVTYEWMTPLLWKGNKRPLIENDLYILDSTDRCNKQYNIFLKYLKNMCIIYKPYHDAQSIS